ncbi:unnamed protein product [Vitrella brassicaformis CCMP3155]|uniref:EF-hand domain-containing protein n=1 Tax=Vitrella brassicaformis (strain CCMP3155) TaxID=1169540 RepID=A0A0G4GVA2_VITBC|nr:unnamed protein product [Vitrella brassicaformis CCMP3155]|eukprot:CEM34605.1 unnamed protein product [Vitrella brassicaformis CCMP3155]
MSEAVRSFGFPIPKLFSLTATATQQPTPHFGEQTSPSSMSSSSAPPSKLGTNTNTNTPVPKLALPPATHHLRFGGGGGGGVDGFSPNGSSGIPTNRTENFRRAAVTITGGGRGGDSDLLVRVLKSWDSDGDGKFSIEDVARAARALQQEQRRSRHLSVILAGIALLYLATLAIFLGVCLGANEISKDFRPDKDGRLIEVATIDGRAVDVSAKETLDSLGMFEMLEVDLADLYKVEALYLEFKSSGEHIEKFYKINEVTRNTDKHIVEIAFANGDTMTMIPEGANLYDKGDVSRTTPLAVFKGPAYNEGKTEEANKLIRHTSLDIDANKLTGDDGGVGSGSSGSGSDGNRQLQPGTRFGVQGGRAKNVFFNVGRLIDNGFIDISAERFQVLAVRGRCLGTRFECRSF